MTVKRPPPCLRIGPNPATIMLIRLTLDDQQTHSRACSPGCSSAAGGRVNHFDEFTFHEPTGISSNQCGDLDHDISFHQPRRMATEPSLSRSASANHRPQFHQVPFESGQGGTFGNRHALD